jgi:membrane associated rhomboid family serine protease
MAFLQSAPPREPMLRAPAIVLLLIAALVAAHLARLWLAPESDAVIAQYAFIPARYSAAFLNAHGYNPGSLWDRAFPFVSYIFLHAGFVHLGMNCLWLLALGAAVARRFGSLLFLLFFFICGIAGAASVLVLDWGSLMEVIGASGAISGLMGAAIRTLPVQRGWNFSGEEPLLPLLSRPVLIFTAAWIVINLLAGLTSFGANLTGGGVQPIAWQAHVGGYLAGLLLAGPFDRLRPHDPVEVFSQA